MKTLDEIIRLNKQIRVLGIDDAPFSRQYLSPVNLCGVICSETRFEGMLWGETERDGLNATQDIIELIISSKFLSQTHVILIDGIAVGGFNVIDLQQLSETFNRPCVAVMRQKPNLVAIEKALNKLPEAEFRLGLINKAGPIIEENGFVFQVHGCNANTAARALERVTDKGNVPEALRLAHLISSAVKTGQSSKRA